MLMNFCYIHKFIRVTVFTCSMICRMVLSLTTPDDFSEPASLGSVSVMRKTQIKHLIHNYTSYKKRSFIQVVNCLLAVTNSSGSSLFSFSLAASEIGPNITTGLLNPAGGGERKKKHLVHKHVKLLN